MANVALNPIVLNNVKFTVAADDYETAVSTVEFVPSTSIVTYKGMTPSAVFSFATTATWVCNVTFAQDWSTPNSLSRYLYENEGEEVEVIFEPVSGGPAFSATIIIVPGSIGGSVDSVAVATVSLGSKGKPELVTGA